MLSITYLKRNFGHTTFQLPVVQMDVDWWPVSPWKQNHKGGEGVVGRLASTCLQFRISSCPGSSCLHMEACLKIGEGILV